MNTGTMQTGAWAMVVMVMAGCVGQTTARQPASSVDPVRRTTAFPNVPIFVANSDEASFSQIRTTRPSVAPVVEKSVDVVVVGSGLAGLSAAAFLVKAQKSVLVLEKENFVGGLAAYGKLEDDTTYDRGAAYFTNNFTEEYEILRAMNTSRTDGPRPDNPALKGQPMSCTACHDTSNPTGKLVLGGFKNMKIAEPIDSYYWDGRNFSGLWDPETLGLKTSTLNTSGAPRNVLPPSFALFQREQGLEGKEKLIPNQPFEEFGEVGGKADLDTMSAAQWICGMPTKMAARTDTLSRKIMQTYATRYPSWQTLPCDLHNAAKPEDNLAGMSGLLGLMDLYCRSALGASCAKVSAMAFANFYISEVIPRYTSPHGTGIAALTMQRLLRESGRSEILTSAKVTRIAQSLSAMGGATANVANVKVEPPSVTVDYLSTDASGHTVAHRVSARYVVYAGQIGFAPQIIDGLREKRPAQTALMDRLTHGGYSHYSVHNVKVTGHPFRSSYDTWVRAADYNSEKDFTDVIIGRWSELNGFQGTNGYRDFTAEPPGDDVMSIYHPLPQSEIGAGYTDERAALRADQAVSRMLQLFSPLAGRPGLESADVRDALKNHSSTGGAMQMEWVRTNRWAYSVHIARPGYFMGAPDEHGATLGGPVLKGARLLRQPFGNVFFANNNLGTPAFEEALFRGHCAAANILERADGRARESWSRCPIDHPAFSEGALP